jgi:hypothetical protein
LSGCSIRSLLLADVCSDLLQFEPNGRYGALRAKIAETTPLALITEQGENRNQLEKQWNLSGFPHDFACRGT